MRVFTPKPMVLPGEKGLTKEQARKVVREMIERANKNRKVIK